MWVDKNGNHWEVGHAAQNNGWETKSQLTIFYEISTAINWSRYWTVSSGAFRTLLKGGGGRKFWKAGSKIPLFVHLQQNIQWRVMVKRKQLSLSYISVKVRQFGAQPWKDTNFGVITCTEAAILGLFIIYHQNVHASRLCHTFYIVINQFSKF